MVVRYAKESVKQNTKCTFAVDYGSVNFVGVARNSKNVNYDGGGSAQLRDGLQRLQGYMKNSSVLCISRYL